MAERGEGAVRRLVLGLQERREQEETSLLGLKVGRVEEDITAVVEMVAVVTEVAVALATPLASSYPTSRACRAATAMSQSPSTPVALPTI